MSAKFQEALDPRTSTLYGRVRIAMITGWSFEYIDALGWLDWEAILQIHDALNFQETKR